MRLLETQNSAPDNLGFAFQVELEKYHPFEIGNINTRFLMICDTPGGVGGAVQAGFLSVRNPSSTRLENQAPDIHTLILPGEKR